MKHIKEVLDEVRPVLKKEIERNVKMMVVIDETIKELKKLKNSLKEVQHEMGN
tara:strand:- start:473 stop:631 length:159 start_codon:yes stop_codon:yes gene_type:complete